MAKTYTVNAGDDEEFAFLLRDPNTGAIIDLSVNPELWTITVNFKGKRGSLTKAYTGAGIILNSVHVDPDIEDGSMQVLLTQVESLALPAATYAIWIKVTDPSSLDTTVLSGEQTLIIQTTPLSAI